MLGQGIYSFRDAARLTRLHTGRVRSWFRPRGEAQSIFTPEYPPIEGRYSIDFLDLVEVRLVGALRQMNISMQKIRRLYAHLRRLIEADHPFASYNLLTDGKTLFLRCDDELNNEILIDVARFQQEFPEFILPLLTSLDFDQDTELALRWRIGEGVVVDPQLNLGKPTAVGSGIPTRILADAYVANGEDAAKVARFFDRPIEAVLNSVRFERTLH